MVKPAPTLTRATMAVRGQINLRMDDEDRTRLEALQKRYGLSQAGVVTMLIRDRCVELSRDEGFDWKKSRKLGDR